MPPSDALAHSDSWSRFRLLLPFYLGVAGMVGASAIALSGALSSPDFTARLQALALAGVAASLLGACTGRNPSLLGAVVAVLVLPMLVLGNAGAAVTELFFPSESLSDHSLLLPTLAMWGTAALSFALVDRSNSIFIFVCGLVVFGLTGTVNVNESLILLFFVFLFSTFFVWGYGNLLSQRERGVDLGQPTPPRPARWAHTQLGVGAAITGGVFALAVIAGYPSYRYTPALFAGPFAPRFMGRVAAAIARNFAGFDQRFTLKGGPIHLSDTPAMEVECQEAALWRGMVYDSYDSSGWTHTIPGPHIVSVVRERGLFASRAHMEALRPLGKRKALRQRFTLEITTGSVIPAAAVPVSFRSEDGLALGVLDPHGCLRSNAGTRAGMTYAVVSERSVAGKQELAAAPDRYPSEIAERSLGVPALSRSKLQGLADEITANCRNPYEKVEAIEAYLYAHCRYTLDVPPIPGDADAVAYFLQVTKRGACDLYASSLAVLLRLSGVPARVAVGFATGQYDPAVGAYRVLQSDAHAWTEVYFPTIGWVEFDPPSEPAPEETSWLAKLFQPGWAGPMLRDAARKVGLTAIILLLVNALVVAVVGASPTGMLHGWLRRRRWTHDPRQQAALTYERACAALRQRGLSRQAWQTPGELVQAVRASGALRQPQAVASLERFTSHFERLRYGAAEPSDQDLARLAKRAGILARRIRRARRRR